MKLYWNAWVQSRTLHTKQSFVQSLLWGTFAAASTGGLIYCFSLVLSHLTVCFLPSSINSTGVPPAKKGKLLVPKDAILFHYPENQPSKAENSISTSTKQTHSCFCRYHAAKTSEKGSYKRPQILLAPNIQLGKFVIAALMRGQVWSGTCLHLVLRHAKAGCAMAAACLAPAEGAGTPHYQRWEICKRESWMRCT